MESENIYKFKREIQKKPSEILLADCEFSIRAYQSLKGLNITNLEELTNFTEEELPILLPFINQRTIKEAKEILVKHGLDFRRLDTKID